MRRSDFDEVMTALVKPDGPGAAVAVQQGGEVIHLAGYGLANVEWGAPITPDTVFRIGSITKQFTAAAIMRLVEQGKLSVDDPIETHLPDYPVNGRRISLRHLLHHTSGIKSYTSLPNFARDLMRKDLFLGQLIDVFKDLEPDFEPGERFLYCNSGYVLLGAIIEACSGRDYETYLAEEFFKPLGMARTRYLHDQPIVPGRAAGYVQLLDLQNAPSLSMSLPHAAGALGSTVEDLLTWDRALRDGRAVSQASYAAMIAPGRLNDGSPVVYGFGLVSREYRGLDFVEHAGGINGFVSDLAHWPSSDLTIAVLANLSSFPMQRALFALARRALGLPDTLRTQVPLSAAQLAACAGTYRFDTGALVVEAADSGLTVSFPVPGTVFRPFAEASFWLEGDPENVLRFDDLQDGRYKRATWEGPAESTSGDRIVANGVT